MTRLFGSREIALGAATLLASGATRRNLVLAGIAVDAADAARLARRRGARGRPDHRRAAHRARRGRGRGGCRGDRRRDPAAARGVISAGSGTRMRYADPWEQCNDTSD